MPIEIRAKNKDDLIIGLNALRQTALDMINDGIPYEIESNIADIEVLSSVSPEVAELIKNAPQTFTKISALLAENNWTDNNVNLLKSYIDSESTFQTEMISRSNTDWIKNQISQSNARYINLKSKLDALSNNRKQDPAFISKDLKQIIDEDVRNIQFEIKRLVDKNIQHTTNIKNFEKQVKRLNKIESAGNSAKISCVTITKESSNAELKKFKLFLDEHKNSIPNYKEKLFIDELSTRIETLIELKELSEDQFIPMLKKEEPYFQNIMKAWCAEPDPDGFIKSSVISQLDAKIQSYDEKKKIDKSLNTRNIKKLYLKEYGDDPNSNSALVKSTIGAWIYSPSPQKPERVIKQIEKIQTGQNQSTGFFNDWSCYSTSNITAEYKTKIANSKSTDSNNTDTNTDDSSLKYS